MKKIKLYSILSILFLFTFCRDEEAIIPESTNPQDYIIEVGAKTLRTVVGQVIDQDGNPVSNASVHLFASETSTDEDGRFEFFEKEAFETHAYVKVEKEGYLLGSRSIVPSDGVNMMLIKLLPANTVGIFEASAGGEVTFDEVKIKFGSAFVTQSGATYKGKVIVKASYLDPLAEDIGDIMPGSLRATSEDGETYLKTFGMIGVELQDESGNDIEIAKGSNAQISMPIPAEMSADAPSSIPLWHFDEDKGYWIEEGEAKNIDGKYVGEVEHFSFWNCDIRVPSLTSFGRLIDAGGAPLCGFQVILSSQSAGARSGYTDSDGNFGGIIPADVSLYMSVRRHGYEIFKKNIAPLSEGELIGDIEVDYIEGDAPVLITLTGNAENCNGSPFNGYVRSSFGSYFKVDNGVFSFTELSGIEYDITLVNIYGITEGLSLTGVVKEEDDKIGTLVHCDPKQGVWIDEFSFVGISEYTIAFDELNIKKFNVVNPAVFEDLDNGIFRFKSGTQNGGSGVDYFTIDIPTEHLKRGGAFKVTDDSDNKVKFYTGNSYDEVRNLDLNVELGGLRLFEGVSSQISVYGTLEMKNSEGDFEEGGLLMQFDFRL